MRITYMYPMRKRVSFSIVAEHHIQQLRRLGINPHVVNIHNFTPDDVRDTTIVHPIFYPLIDNPRAYKILIRNAKNLIGFDVCDTDRLSPLASYVANLFDVVVVPSRHCMEVYKNSGVMSRIEVLPHGIEDEFLRNPREPRDPDIRRIAEKRGIKILFFLWHSGFRKGADVVAEAFARLVKERSNVWLIVKLAGVIDPFIQYMYYMNNVVLFNKWLEVDDLVDLYDACDIVVCPSRGGGFELNALEGLARGKIVVVSQWGAFNDYCSECVRVGSRGTVDIFLGDRIAKQIHNGRGIDPDPINLYEKLNDIINRMPYYEKKFKRLQEWVRENYTWEKIGDKLYKIISKYI